MSEILMPALMYVIILFGAAVIFTTFFVSLASFLDWFHQDERPHVSK